MDAIPLENKFPRPGEQHLFLTGKNEALLVGNHSVLVAGGNKYSTKKGGGSST